MKFDAVIIGGGLAGLTCGIKLAQQKKKSVIISSGQSALHFSSGSFDLLNVVGKFPVDSPADKMPDLVIQNPNHPYAKIGYTRFMQYADEAKQLLLEAGVEVIGDADRNHYRITPLGNLKPTWLSVKDFAVSDNCLQLPWGKVAIFNITGFLDFHPALIADEFMKMGVKCEIFEIDMPELKTLRKNPSELRATNIARLFDDDVYLGRLSEIVKRGTDDADALIFPACVGLRANSLEKLSKEVGKPIRLIPTFPPSVVGIRTQQLLSRHYEKLGGIYMLGDTVKAVNLNDDFSTAQVFTENHGDIPFVANNVVLASGSYFSQGLIATSTRVVEPIMELDVDFIPERDKWTSARFFDDQNYQRFGVKTNRSFNVLKDDQIQKNVFAVGAVQGGFNALKEGCGSGVSMLTAIAVAEEIINA